jgi:hypothetical protein
MPCTQRHLASRERGLPQALLGDIRMMEVRLGTAMWTWLKSLFSRPAPTGPQQKLRVFSLNKGTISKGCVRVENDSWRIDSTEKQTVRLFDLQHPEAEQCLLTYRAEIKSENLNGRAYLEMWCRLPGRGEFFRRAHSKRFPVPPTGPLTKSGSTSERTSGQISSNLVSLWKVRGRFG